MIPTISPTQIDTWRSCHRKWAFTYISGLPRSPSTKAQLIGIDLHWKVENYLKTGEYDLSGGKEADRLFPFILPYLPPPGTPSEQKVTVTLDGIVFGGKFDWHFPGEIGDLKTTSSLQYVKSEKELSTHAQPLIYMKATGEHRGRWLYVQTRGAAHVRAVPFAVDFSGLDSVIQDGHNIARAWEEKGNPNDYPANPSACDMYGGCPFKLQCNLTAGDRLIALMRKDQKMTDVNEDLNALLAKIGGGINPPMPEPSPEGAPVDQTGVAPLTVPAEPLPPVLDPVKAEAAPEPPKKRGRPRKTPETSPEEKAPDTARSTPDPRPIGTLYVSCMPMNRDVVLADNLFTTARAKVAEKTGKEDYRLIEYGQGAAGLLIEVTDLVNGIRPDALVVDDNGPEARVCLSALISMSREVIRRF